MTDRPNEPSGDAPRLSPEPAEDALSELADAAAGSAEKIQRVFDETGQAVERSLVSAARSGELSLRRLAETIATTFAGAAFDELVQGPLEAGIAGIAARVPFLGARADGGSVVPGGAYLVGERGPELFTPPSAGTVSRAAAPITVNIAMGGAAEPQVRRTQGQLETLVARAVARGQRNL